jgi:hypothetical protein
LLYSSYLSQSQIEDTQWRGDRSPLNHVKRNGCCMHHQALYQNSYAVPGQYIYVFCVAL